LAFAWETATTPPFVVDDSYITFAFSKNLARGAGPVYGQDLRIDGYSNFLWMVLVAGPLAILRDVDPLVIARALTIPFVMLLAGATYALARVRSGVVLAAAATLLVAVNIDVVLAFHSGLETLAYAALVTAGVASYARRSAGRAPRRLALAFLTAAALMRIDGFIPLAYVIAFDAVERWTLYRVSAAALARWALPSALVCASWFVWQWAYYGLPLPSTYYAKALIPELLPRRGPEYVYDELFGSGLLLAMPAFGYLLWKRHRPSVVVGVFAVAQLTYAAAVGGDWMPTGRFVLPAVPLLVALLAWAAQELVDGAAERGRTLHVMTTAAALAGALWLGSRVEPHQSPKYVGDKLARAREQIAHVESLKHAAALLDLAVPPGGRLVTDYGGVLAYYTDADPIEMWGLCNTTIATRGGTRGINPIYGRTCPECYPELDPEYFHVMQPLVRDASAFGSHDAVVRAVWQSASIGEYLDIRDGFASGRVVDEQTGDAVWFLERKGPGWQPNTWRPRAGVVVEYPFADGAIAFKR
jgi:hypothetical protein